MLRSMRTFSMKTVHLDVLRRKANSDIEVSFENHALLRMIEENIQK